MTARSLFKHLALAAALSVGGYVGSEALAPLTGTSLVSQAHADFTGRIKRIKIKKRGNSSNDPWKDIKVVGRTSGTDSTTVAAATVMLSVAGTGEPLGSYDLGEPKRARVDTSINLADSGLEIVNGTTVSVQFSANDCCGGAIVDIIPDVLMTGEEGEFLRGEGVSEAGFKARLRINRAGKLTAVLMNEDKDWAGGVIEANLLTDEGAAYPLAIEGVRQRRVVTTDINLEAVGPVQIATTLFAEDGSVLDTRTEIVSVTEDIVPEVSNIRVRETNGGNAKLVSITAGSGGEASLAVSITDAETGEVVLETVDDSPVSSVRTFFAGGIEFDGDESPANYVYLVLIDMIDANGDPVGQQHEIELLVPEYVAGEVVTTVVPFGDGVGQVVMAVDDDGYHFGTGVVGDSNVMAANLIFEEPFEGPAPLELEVTTEFVGQFDKWIQKGDAALPANYTVSTTLTEAGVVVGGVEGASGEGTGTVYKASGNGSGTRIASSTVQQQQVELL